MHICHTNNVWHHGRSIEPADREFFAVVAQTAFCNPFSEQRPELDASIVGHPVEPLSEAHLDEMTQVISARVQKLEAAGPGGCAEVFRRGPRADADGLPVRDVPRVLPGDSIN